jgi:hypothetical protein
LEGAFTQPMFPTGSALTHPNDSASSTVRREVLKLMTFLRTGLGRFVVRRSDAGVLSDLVKLYLLRFVLNRASYEPAHGFGLKYTWVPKKRIRVLRHHNARSISLCSIISPAGHGRELSWVGGMRYDEVYSLMI